MTRPSSAKGEYALGTIAKWPERLTKVPSRAIVMKNGLDVFEADARRWARRVAYYRNSLNLELKPPAVRNVMDMNAFFGGFAAALASDPVWVMNVIPARKPLTLDVIYDRGLIGVYHDWLVTFVDQSKELDIFSCFFCILAFAEDHTITIFYFTNHLEFLETCLLLLAGVNPSQHIPVHMISSTYRELNH